MILNQILDFLFLGSEESGQIPLNELQEKNITHILIPAITGRPKEVTIKYPDSITYKQLKIYDVPGYPIDNFFFRVH